jgi:hypothetical protein
VLADNLAKTTTSLGHLQKALDEQAGELRTLQQLVFEIDAIAALGHDDAIANIRKRIARVYGA